MTQPSIVVLKTVGLSAEVHIFASVSYI